MKQKKSKRKVRILVLEPDEKLASTISDVIQEAFPTALVEMTRSLEEAQERVLGVKPQLFVLDVDEIQDLGQDFLYDLRTSHPNARAIVLTGVHLPEQREHVTGLGAIHFLEKPVAHWDFVELVQRLLQPAKDTATEKFQGTLRDLQFTDIIQLKCMSGATSVVEFTGPSGEKARVFFDRGQVRHATAPGRQGMAAFNEIVRWEGGTVSEVADAPPSPRTIDMDWQQLLMEAVRSTDETEAAQETRSVREPTEAKSKVLAIDDSLMLLSFVHEVLIEGNYEAITALNGTEGVRAAQINQPNLILLDYFLPDMKGDEVCRKLLEEPATSRIPVVYMSGFAGELRSDQEANPNVIGFLNKPFTSDLLIQTVETHMPKSPEEPEPAKIPPGEEAGPTEPEFPVEQEPAYREASEIGPQPEQAIDAQWWTPAPSATPEAAAGASFAAPAAEEHYVPDESLTGGAYFCGDTRFFSLSRALQTIAAQKLTGSLRAFWNKEPVELLARDGEIVLATTQDPELYCAEAPVTLANVDPDRIAAARDEQRLIGCPLFVTLMQENLILREPALQLVEHHGQKLFAQLWSEPVVRFVFERNAQLPDYVNQLPSEPDVDHWALASLRFLQFPHLGERGYCEPASVPAYTRDGFQRVQNLRLTVAEAQFASQFNGTRSVQQIAKNLRLDLKFARLTLFRFLALEIVECWPPVAAVAPESKGVFHRLAQAVGLGE